MSGVFLPAIGPGTTQAHQLSCDPLIIWHICAVGSEGSIYTYHEFITRFKLCFDFLADVVVRDTQVLPDVAVVTHQGHVALVDVNQLRR